MKLLISIVSICLFAPAVASADYLDVIATKLKDGCSLADYNNVVEEFRGVMTSEKYSYSVEIAVPFTGPELDVVYWIGRTKDIATFGMENGRWDQALRNAKSPEAKINAKLEKCSINLRRTGSTTQ
jgi:hypothetical protein